MTNFVKLGKVHGITGTPTEPNKWNWGIIEASKGGIPEAVALTAENLFQGLALAKSKEAYGIDNIFTYSDFSKFNNEVAIRALEVMIKYNLLAQPTDKTADADNAVSLTSLQVEALSVIAENSILTSGQIAAAKLYTSKTQLYELSTNLDHNQAINNGGSNSDAESLSPDSDEWTMFVNKNKAQTAVTKINNALNIVNTFSTKAPFLTSICSVFEAQDRRVWSSTNSYGEPLATDMISLLTDSFDCSPDTNIKLFTGTPISNVDETSQCLEIVSRITNGTSSAHTINAADATECRERVVCSAVSLPSGDLQTLLADDTSSFFNNVQNEICAQFNI